MEREEGTSQSTQREKQPKGPSFFPKLQFRSISQGSKSRIARPTFIIEVLRAGTSGTEDAALGKDPGGSLCPATAPAGFLRPGATLGNRPSGTRALTPPISLTQMFLPSQAKPDPRAKPAGDNAQLPLVSRKHCLCGWVS